MGVHMTATGASQFCPGCGKHAVGETFCGNCGASLLTAAAPAAPTSAAPAPAPEPAPADSAAAASGAQVGLAPELTSTVIRDPYQFTPSAGWAGRRWP